MLINKDAISIIGLGYVGLCTAATFASRGFKTVGIDIDQDRVRKIQQGKSPIYEPQLEGLVKKTVRNRMFDVTTEIDNAATTSTTFLTVGTPGRPDGSIDTGYLQKAARELGSTLRKKLNYHLVVVKSTVIPGTTRNTVKPILEKSSHKNIGSEIGLCTNPEFLKEGTAIYDTLNPDKIVIGCNDEKSSSALKRLFRKFYGAKLPPVIATSPETAELVKYASNAFLATKISFINTIANIAQQIPGVDVGEVASAIGHDPRIGSLFLKAGPGYGGSCFHKDIQALIHYSSKNGYDPMLLRETEETNEEQANRVVKLSEKLLGDLDDKRVAVLGLAFKKDTDDIREAASVRVIAGLHQKGARIVAYDPMAITNARKLLPESVEFASDPRSAIKGADCSIIMTEWDEFKKLRSKDYKAYMRRPNLVDARRIYDPKEFEEINYVGIGLGLIDQKF